MPNSTKSQINKICAKVWNILISIWHPISPYSTAVPWWVPGSFSSCYSILTKGSYMASPHYMKCMYPGEKICACIKQRTWNIFIFIIYLKCKTIFTSVWLSLIKLFLLYNWTENTDHKLYVLWHCLYITAIKGLQKWDLWLKLNYYSTSFNLNKNNI